MFKSVFTGAVALLALAVLPVSAQDTAAIPERRAILSMDFDLPGGDLRTMLDTTLETCERSCLSDSQCMGYTFNSRNNSCFPKGSLGTPSPYQGAISAQITAATATMISRAAERKADLGFLPDTLLGQALRQAQTIGRSHVAGPYSADSLREAARAAEAAGEPERALRITGGWVSASDDANAWLDYARLSLVTFGLRNDTSGLYRPRALHAAINAYLRAPNDALRHSALAQMALTLEANSMGRNALAALRLAQQITPRDDTQTALERLSGLFGLRIDEHRLEADLASPRLCAVFTEEIIQKGFDYSPFVQLPKAGLTVEPSGDREICVEGLDHGARVSVTFREGLPSKDGQTLAKSVTLSGYMRDRKAQLRFAGSGYVLPKGGEAALPVVSVNATKLDLKLYSVSDRGLITAEQSAWIGRPMDDWDANRFTQQLGEEIWSGTAEVESPLNIDQTTRLPLGEALKGRAAGIYALKAWLPGTEDDYETPAAWQWFVVSDLGLTTLSGVDGLTVVARSLADASAKSGAKVQLLARSNRVLAEVETDAEGVARFDAGVTKGTGAAQPAMVVVSGPGTEQDLAFLSLKDPEFDLTDRGVAGRAPSPPIDVFLKTERGAYRAGETMHATVLARDDKARALPGLPLTAVLRRPDGVEHSRNRITDLGGGYALSVPISASAPRGSWRLDILADPEAPALATTSFLVEDFLPERIDFGLDLEAQEVAFDSLQTFPLEVRYLFGAPAAGLAIEGDVILRAASGLAAHPGYRFGDSTERFDPRMSAIAGLPQTDAAGRAELQIALPEGAPPTQPLEAVYVIRVAEGSNRPVERQLIRPVALSAPMIGLKPAFEGVLPEGTEARFSALLARPEGEADTPLPATWRIERIEIRYQWYSLGGDWNWEPITSRKLVAEGQTELGATPVEIAAPVQWGQFRLTVSAQNGAVLSATEFSAGWYASADTTHSPDTLELSLDKPHYKIGDTARLRVVPRTAGTALVSVLSNRVIALKAVELAAGENIIELPVTEEWGAGAYVTASALRPTDQNASRGPGRAMGLAHAAIDPAEKQLATTIVAPSEAMPRAEMELAVKVEGVQPGDKAYVTLAAVDLGILNLTGYQAPDPSGHYFGQRKLGVGIRDLYGRLIDTMNGAEGRVRSGGDAGSARLQADPPTEELVAYFEGPIEVDAEGYARARVTLPAFNGTLRVMAVAWSDSGIGQAQADVLVRDPVVVTASLPRFLQPGDHSRLLLEVIHATGPSGRMSLDLSGHGLKLGQTPSGFDLTDGGKHVISVPVTAETAGLGRIEARLTTPDGKVLTKTLNLPVAPKDPIRQEMTRIELAAGQTMRFGPEIFAGFRGGEGHALISAGGLARFDVPGLMSSLDAYPWGCAEQLTSRALPLLNFSQLADVMGLSQAQTARERIAQTISELLLMQTSEGGFGLWSARSGTSFWLDGYVTDFLSRARAGGHEVPERAFRAALDNLRNQVNYAGDFETGGEALAFALMVLAREGAAAVGDLRYYADVKAEAFSTPLALAQLGAALAAYGDQPRADALFGKAATRIKAQSGETAQVWRADFGTNLRDLAGVLSLALEAGSSAVDREAFAARIAQSVGRSALSTQEQAYILMAAQGYADAGIGEGLSVDGAPVTGMFLRKLASTEGGFALENTSNRPISLSLASFGPSSGTEKAEGRGYSIERSYYGLDGAEVDIASVKTGTRLVAVLTVTPHGNGAGRLLIEDPLPAGLEIDNPNLMRAGQVADLGWLELQEEVSHAEFRQDRFMAALDWRENRAFRLGYIVRAISPGAYHHAAASVEDMYRPTFRGHSASGKVIVTE